VGFTFDERQFDYDLALNVNRTYFQLLSPNLRLRWANHFRIDSNHATLAIPYSSLLGGFGELAVDKVDMEQVVSPGPPNYNGTPLYIRLSGAPHGVTSLTESGNEFVGFPM
jgi:hypothetical protein